MALEHSFACERRDSFCECPINDPIARSELADEAMRRIKIEVRNKLDKKRGIDRAKIAESEAQAAVRASAEFGIF
jgi:hypothetical protein